MSTTTTTTVSQIANVIIAVDDQDAMLAFYTDKLGLEKRADIPFGNGDRWIEVGPAGSETPIALCPPGPNGQAGNRDTGITLQVDDIDSYHAQLQAAGVDIDAEVSRMGDPVPPICWLHDPEGNSLMVVEVK
jgi:catechol 2,3-dioxygenase-like lactoylglutathione lyase family enzyme